MDDDPLRRWAEVPPLDLLPATVARRLTVIHPTQAPGFWEFRALGCGPVVPEQPPTPGAVPRTPWLRSILAWSVVIVLYVCCLLLELTWIGWVVLVLGILGAGYLSLVDQVRMLTSLLDRAARGFTFKGSHVAQGGAGSQRNNGARTRVAFDMRGVWLLRRDGTVITSPDRRVLAPGWYPSPTTPLTLEAWSGAMWLEGTPLPVGPEHPARDALVRAWAGRTP